MPAVRFCTKCGFRPVLETGSPTSAGIYCSRCSPHSRRVRLGFLSIAMLCAAIGFAAGRYTTTREPLYIIGTPIQTDAKGIAMPDQPRSTLTADGEPSRVDVGTVSATSTTICGARTKSGKTCQRKVKGGGFCWQHRAKGKEQSAKGTG